MASKKNPAIYVSLLCKIVGPKIRSCKVFDKFQVCICIVFESLKACFYFNDNDSLAKGGS